MIEVEGLFVLSVVECDVKRAAQCHNEFAAFLMGMSATAFASGNVCNPIGTSDLEGNVCESFCYGEVSSGVYMLGKLYDFA
jgi:hypothetical protein